MNNSFSISPKKTITSQYHPKKRITSQYPLSLLFKSAVSLKLSENSQKIAFYCRFHICQLQWYCDLIVFFGEIRRFSSFFSAFSPLLSCTFLGCSVFFFSVFCDITFFFSSKQQKQKKKQAKRISKGNNQFLFVFLCWWKLFSEQYRLAQTKKQHQQRELLCFFCWQHWKVFLNFCFLVERNLKKVLSLCLPPKKKNRKSAQHHENKKGLHHENKKTYITDVRFFSWCRLFFFLFMMLTLLFSWWRLFLFKKQKELFR